MKRERLRVLDLLEQGKITAEEASKLLEALKVQTIEFEDIDNDLASDVEEKLNKFSKSMDSFARDFGEKMSGAFKDVEPKVKNITKHVITRTASIMDDISKSLNETLKNMDSKDCCCGEKQEENKEETCCCDEKQEEKKEDSCCDNEPREN